MASKYHNIAKLSRETAKQVTKNEEEWRKYLDTAANIYRYPFQEQLLIYAQRPDATACANIQTWNEKMFCWVNRGAKGIALIDEDAAYPKLKYVFDVSDVHESKVNGRKPYLWKMGTEHEESIITRLESIYGAVDESQPFAQQIMELSHRITEDNLDEILDELEEVSDRSFLEGLDRDSLRVRMRESLSSSIAYTIMKRCGIDTEDYLNQMNFEAIHEFNTVTTLSVLGSYTSDLSEPILREIGLAVRTYDRHMAQAEELEENLKKDIAKDANVDYNALKRESESIEENIQERGNEHESSISRERGLSDSESDNRRNRGEADQVRNDEKDFFERGKERHLHGDVTGRDSDESLADDSKAGRGTERVTDETAAGVRGSDRGTERNKPDGMGSPDEQHPEQSRRNIIDGLDLSVEPNDYEQISLFPSAAEQRGNIAVDTAGTPYAIPTAFLIPDALVEEVLKTGSGKTHSRIHIAHEYQKNITTSDFADILKKEYGKGGKGFEYGSTPIAVWYDENGMFFNQGKEAKNQFVRSLSWTEIAERMEGLIASGRFMEEVEAQQIDLVTDQELASKIYFFFRDEYNQMPEFLQDKVGSYPDAEDRIVEMLANEEDTKTIIQEMYGAITDIADGKVEPRFRLRYRPVDILDELREHLLAKIDFPKAENMELLEETFITDDELDAVLSGGSGFENGSFRIYEFFNELHDRKEQVDFLKREYGTGGRSHALIGRDNSWEDHDAKGLKLKKGRISNPEVEILLNWNKVAERIDTLVKSGRYLSSEKQFKYEEWKEDKEQKALLDAQRELGEKQHDDIDEPDTSRQSVGKLEPILQNEEKEVTEPKAVDYEVGNFHITDDTLGNGSLREKYQRNVQAIRLLKQLETEERPASKDEQRILSNYVGWGGLQEAFDDRNNSWSKEYHELKSVLDAEEYTSARESVLNAHYTQPAIIRGIYDTIERMGFQKGNLLEPAMGVGNFFGMIPDSMQEAKLYGVELDSISGRIAKQLYPDATISVTGYENTAYPDSFFDAAVGNVPFGSYKIADRKYDKNHFLVHDYFFGKTLDQVRPGGVIAFVTSKGTLDKENPAVRKYIAQRAELLGAVRLPNTAFKANAGTEVTSDIVFLKKRDRLMDLEPDWVHLGTDNNGITMNQYFVDHPEMIVGTMEEVSGPFGMETTCKAKEGDFKEQLKAALSHIEGQIEEIEVSESFDDTDKETLPADPLVKNYSYTLVDDTVYYRENSIMRPVEASDSMLERMKGMIGIRESAYELINKQLDEFGEDAIKEEQEKLNRLYDTFTKKYGLINSQTNGRAFRDDAGYCLLCSLEVLGEDGTLKRKADMFHKRTIKRQAVAESVDTASEALTISMQEKASVDLEYMSKLTGKDKDTLTTELTGVIFCNPLTDKWETADEYLSGNVREKLIFVRELVETHPEYASNLEALKAVQPKDLDASEIDVRIGATWVDPKYIIEFMKETFETPERLFERDIMDVKYSSISGQWNVKGKNSDYGNVLAYNSFGTSRANAYRILEDSLNLKDTRIFDTIYEDGKEKRVLNKKETMLASQKQEAIREQFKNWIFKDQERRETLCKTYNELFNSVRQREYDGSHLVFPGMNPEITLKEHQKNAVARQLYGYNAILAHTVGAGKTYTMAAAAMETKRLGLAQKPLFVVPNHLVGQWATEFLQLYPGGNVLAATKRDFEPANRKKFCSRIATGEYDAVIIGHSQFEKIPLSIERQREMIERQITEITDELNMAKEAQGERYTIKQMEKTKKTLQVRLDKLNDTTRKDNVVTFEQLGVDRLFVDESHNYKNLFLYTKMRNVAGIAQTEAQKSSDMFAKCQYMDELTGGRGITFATGTPISNSMNELYTNMRYLMHNTLTKMGLGHFDSWASSFGETTTAIELAPEGTGYRAKTRFSKFFNLPELIGMFKEVADIQTADMLNLPVPKANYHDMVLHPSDFQKEMVEGLAERAERVRNRMVDSSVDNMLKITNDGRKLALDQRLINPLLPDNPDSKCSACVKEAFRIWEDTSVMKGAQLIFCDLSTPKGNGDYNVYEDMRKKLIEKGVPSHEIAFIHDANTDKRKTELFAKVRSGQVRFLLGSTAKMGAGTNVQDRLVALHHLDVPWRPSDIEQQEGRILRQGNQNAEVDIYRYITEGTFDAYSWQLIENKQKFIGQIMTSKSPVRSAEDIDEAALSYAEVKALATGNPYIKEKMDLDIQVSKLKLLKANHISQIYRLEDSIAKDYPKKIAVVKERIEGYEKDIALFKQNKPSDPELFSMKIGEKIYTDRKEAGAALLHTCQQIKIPNRPIAVGEYCGMKLGVEWDSFYNKFSLRLAGSIAHKAEMGSDALGNITRLKNLLEAMDGELEKCREQLENTEKQLANAKIEVTKPFEKEQELSEKLERLNELNALLNMDEKSEEVLEEDDSKETEKPVSFVASERIEEHQNTSIHERLATIKEQKKETNTTINQPHKDVAVSI